MFLSKLQDLPRLGIVPGHKISTSAGSKGSKRTSTVWPTKWSGLHRIAAEAGKQNCCGQGGRGDERRGDAGRWPEAVDARLRVALPALERRDPQGAVFEAMISLPGRSKPRGVHSTPRWRGLIGDSSWRVLVAARKSIAFGNLTSSRPHPMDRMKRLHTSPGSFW